MNGHLAAMQRYYRRNREKRLEYSRSYYLKHKDELLARDRDDRRRYDEKHKEILKNYFLKTNEVYFHREPRERRMLRRATPRWYDVEPIRELYRRCILWNDRNDLEYYLVHTIPIRGRIVCGLNIATNIRVATKSFMEMNRFDQEAASETLLKWLSQRGL